MGEPLLYLEFAGDLPAEARINDVPLARLVPRAHGARAFNPAASLVKTGANTLSVRLAGRAAPSGSKPAEVRARIAVLADGDQAFTDAGQTLAEIRWTPSGIETERTTDFTARTGPRAWSWEASPPLRSGPDTLRSAQALADSLSEPHRLGDAGPLLALAAPKLRDLALAYGAPPEGTFSGVIASDIAAGAPHRPAPPTPFTPVFCGGGRLIECLGADGYPYIRALDEEGDLTTLKLIIGQLEGQWCVFR